MDFGHLSQIAKVAALFEAVLVVIENGDFPVDLAGDWRFRRTGRVFTASWKLDFTIQVLAIAGTVARLGALAIALVPARVGLQLAARRGAA